MSGFMERPGISIHQQTNIVREFIQRPGISKWETDTIKMRIYDPVYYAQHMIHQKPSLFSSVSYIIDDKRKIFGKILEQYQINCSSYRGAEMTSSGQDMSYWVTYRERLMNDYKEKALNDIRNEVIRLITNCKNILIDYNYDMFEEFKKVYPNMANYFNIKRDDITWYYYDRMPTFIECVIKCVLSIEALNKGNEIIRKYEQMQLKMYQERQLLLYKKEFECAKLFDEIDKNKLKSFELYVEYKKITEIKDKGLLSNTQFINYFTEDKKKYINELIELVKNPTPVSNEVPSIAAPILVKVIPNEGDNYFADKEQDTSKNNIVMTVCEVKEKVIHRADVCDTSVKKTQKKGLLKEQNIIRVLNIFTNKNMKKKYFDSGLHKVVLNTPLYDPINEYNKNVNGFWEQHTLGVYLNFLYNKELSEFCLDDKKYYEFMSKSTLIPL
uniref:Uncharacterized protein n=1 Tax=viral metagenome TaxID=1070528 RepID=A0A6C0EWB7_9ZZZZ